MKKIFIVMGLLISSQSVLALTHDSCVEYTENQMKTFKVTKNIKSQNVLYFAVDINDETCEFSAESKVTPYWEMGEEMESGLPTCEAISKSDVKDYIGFSSKAEMESKITNIIDAQTVEVKIPGLVKLGKKISRNTQVEEVITLTSRMNENNECEIESIATVDGGELMFDQLHIKVGFGVSLKIKLDGKTVLD